MFEFSQTPSFNTTHRSLVMWMWMKRKGDKNRGRGSLESLFLFLFFQKKRPKKSHGFLFERSGEVLEGPDEKRLCAHTPSYSHKN